MPITKQERRLFNKCHFELLQMSSDNVQQNGFRFFGALQDRMHQFNETYKEAEKFIDGKNQSVITQLNYLYPLAFRVRATNDFS
jgi:hypothetical protein